jgi:hypothetical protein
VVVLILVALAEIGVAFAESGSRSTVSAHDGHQAFEISGYPTLRIGDTESRTLAYLTRGLGTPCIVGAMPAGLFGAIRGDTYVLWELDAQQNDEPGPFIVVFGRRSLPGYYPPFSGSVPLYVTGLYGPQETSRNWCATGLRPSDAADSGAWSPS